MFKSNCKDKETHISSAIINIHRANKHYIYLKKDYPSG